MTTSFHLVPTRRHSAAIHHETCQYADEQHNAHLSHQHQRRWPAYRRRHAIRMAVLLFRDASNRRIDRRRRSQRPTCFRSSESWARSCIDLASSRNASDYGQTTIPITQPRKSRRAFVQSGLYGAYEVKWCSLFMQFSFVSCCRSGLMLRAGCRSGGIETFRGELRQTGADIRATCLYSGNPWDPDHDAAMRIGTKFRGGGPNLQNGVGVMPDYESPPPRIVIGSRQSFGRRLPKLFTFLRPSSSRTHRDSFRHLASRHHTPQRDE